jgi:hypothetical protein
MLTSSIAIAGGDIILRQGNGWARPFTACEDGGSTRRPCVHDLHLIVHNLSVKLIACYRKLLVFGPRAFICS